MYRTKIMRLNVSNDPSAAPPWMELATFAEDPVQATKDWTRYFKITGLWDSDINCPTDVKPIKAPVEKPDASTVRYISVYVS